MGAREQLNQFGMNNANAQFEREEIIYKDTIFVDPSAQLVDTDLFVSDNKDAMYRNAAFPITSHAYMFTHLRVVHNIAFTVSDPKKQNAYLQHFAENSSILFQKENKVIGTGWFLSALTETAWGDLGSVSATGTYVAPKAKFASWYEIKIPVQLAAGQQFKVSFKAAKGLTAAAYSATDTPYLPSATNFLACGTVGHWIQVQLRGFRWIEARA